jgi:hypothetical protein
MLIVIMLSAIHDDCQNKVHYDKCHYSECHHAECCSAELCSAQQTYQLPMRSLFFSKQEHFCSTQLKDKNIFCCCKIFLHSLMIELKQNFWNICYNWNGNEFKRNILVLISIGFTPSYFCKERYVIIFNKWRYDQTWSNNIS